MADGAGAGDRRAAARVSAVVINVADLEAQTRFWTGLLGSEVLGEEPGWVDVARLGPDGPLLSLQRVPDQLGPKPRLHLDLMVDDFASASRAALDRGATPVSEVHEADTTPWQVFADPEGNEFCLISPY